MEKTLIEIATTLRSISQSQFILVGVLIVMLLFKDMHGK